MKLALLAPLAKDIVSQLVQASPIPITSTYSSRPITMQILEEDMTAKWCQSLSQPQLPPPPQLPQPPLLLLLQAVVQLLQQCHLQLIVLQSVVLVQQSHARLIPTECTELHMMAASTGRLLDVM